MEILFTLFTLIVCVFLLSIGTIFFNKKIKGSCGEINKDCSCSAMERKLCESLGNPNLDKN